ncbi:MAG: FKBP-type peptidyl-prolyl cis-trans isomerase [Gammaproteobacteria bacterium]|nr:FKBP-type peptidyl-prolyl cis-trans isomerase [Gammaproteobacteria bacterium]
MKKHLMALGLAAALIPVAPAVMAADPKLDSTEDKVSYSMGLIFGQRMQNDVPDMNLETFVRGLQDGFSKGTPLLSQEQMQEALQAYQQQQQQKQLEKFEKVAEENKDKGAKYLAENAKRKGVETTKSGLQYEVVTAGSGAAPAAEDKVTVHYTGTLIDGTVFDSSRERGEPVTFPLNGVISGWTEGLQLMKEGGRAKLHIPSELAYGPGGNRTIGPNETLIFDVELLKVEKAGN